MRIRKFWICLVLACGVMRGAWAESLFFEDEPVQDGVQVFEVSKTFAEIYQKLDDVNWAGKNLNVAIESLEGLNPSAHIAATDERVVLVWDDAIIANFPRPSANDWNGFGEITTALILKMRANDPHLRSLSESALYQAVVDCLIRGVDENGRYIYSKAAEIAEDGRILTSVGLEGARDARGNFRVSGIYKGAPADVAGVRAGDLIAEINGMPVAKMSDAELAAVMSGFNSGTSKIKLLTPMGNRDVVLRRATIVLADADVVHRSDPNGGLLEIVVHEVSDAAVAIVNEALARYSDVSGIVLDLRVATGDDERAAAKLGGLFVGAVPVMRIVETASDEVEVVPGGDAITDVPVVVLMSNQTRGTAEALVAAFYENGRGVLVGTPTAGAARIASRIDLNNGGALELLNKSIKTGQGRAIDGRGLFPIVCLSNIRTNQQQNAFFLNVINNDFNSQDFNKVPDVNPDDIRRGCPTITSGADEDAVATAVSVKILTDRKVYNRLIAE
ncbi:MAG: PDZ domain-containing protein [Alphaproteobacteria bacterium]|nr:PDZ domain-containing protein [Alphaproteobacteria bacterium]MBQ8367527.1 PDZ domain-containing protein [Alphaproteobacteria bacterium]